MIDFLRIK